MKRSWVEPVIEETIREFGSLRRINSQVLAARIEVVARLRCQVAIRHDRRRSVVFATFIGAGVGVVSGIMTWLVL